MVWWGLLRWVSKATEKISTFSPTGGVCQAVTARWGRAPCTPPSSTHFQVLDVNNKQTWMSEENEISFPEGGIFLLAGWKVPSYVLV